MHYFLVFIFTSTSLFAGLHNEEFWLKRVESRPYLKNHSFPFVSGHTFRNFADHIFDESIHEINTPNVKKGDIIFVCTYKIEEFFKKYHPFLPPYILLTHNSDDPIPGKHSKMLDDPKILAWFGQNTENCIHPKLHPIPIGIANKKYAHGNTTNFNQIMYAKNTTKKECLLYSSAMSITNIERMEVISLFEKAPFCISQKTILSHKEYLLNLRKCKFVLSPRGNGLDCHRTWETLLMGSIPIVKTSSLDEVYEGLPVLVVQDWNEITEDFLYAKYDEMKKRDYQLERLFIPYWYNKIYEYKEKALLNIDDDLPLQSCKNPDMGNNLLVKEKTG